jgi:hypothetical protein
MKQLLFANWHTMRWIRLIIGLFLMQQAIQFHEILLGFMAIFFLFQAIFNTGCGLNDCSISTIKKPKNE